MSGDPIPPSMSEATISPSSKTSIVVVGAGAAGIDIAQKLSAKVNRNKHTVTLVDARLRHVWLVAGCRMTVTGDNAFPDTAVFPYDMVFHPGRGTMTQGKVVGIEPNKVNKDIGGGHLVFDNDERLAYDVLVLATGSRWPGPLDFPDDTEERDHFVDQWRDKFREAKDVTLVGGGAVGIEFAGELRDEFPEKKITLIHGKAQLLNDTYPAKFRKRVEDGLRKRNIDLVLGEFVTNFPGSDSGDLILRSGKQITTDCIVRTTGPKPNTNFIAKSLGRDVLSADKRVRVTPELQLPSHPSIFAAGDIIDWSEHRQTARAAAHANIVVENVRRYITGKRLTKRYKGASERIVISNGKGGGTGYLPFFGGIVLGDWYARFVKSKLFDKAKDRMGY